jgi:hypothetical protein
MVNRFERLNEYNIKNDKETINDSTINKDDKNTNKENNKKVNKIDNKKDEKINNKDNNKMINTLDKNSANENHNKTVIKPTRFIESLLQNKKEERVVVGFRLEKSVDEMLEAIVKQNGLKKSDFVNDVLKKALGLN